MTSTAPNSSMMAGAVRNALRVMGTREPSTASTPRAMSVAAGLAQPRMAVGSPQLKAMNTAAGTSRRA